MVAPSGHAEADSRNLVEVRIAASAAQISAVRVVAADIAARQDFDLDAVSDLRMAVDEACATLVPLAVPGSVLSCRFMVGVDSIEVLAKVNVPRPTRVQQNTFGWRVLSTLTDEVQAISQDFDDADGRPSVGILLCLRRDRTIG
ncbi:MAG TPA: ATP-binding protein [Pseudonocardiaceae bacterium]